MRCLHLTCIVWLCLGGVWGCSPAPRPQIIQVQAAEDNGKQSQSDYVAWLEERSMLHQARQQAHQVSGKGVQWRHPYGDPQPEQVVKRASVWLLGRSYDVRQGGSATTAA